MNDARPYKSPALAAVSERRRAVTAASPPTHRQREVLALLYRGVLEHGVQPSLTELAAALKVRSHNAVSGLLRSLEKKGYVERCCGESRAVSLIRMPDGKPFPGLIPRTSELEDLPGQHDGQELDSVASS